VEIKEIATYIVIILIGIIIASHMNVVVSGSMEPVLYRGDIVIIDSNPNPDNIQVGDIIVYKATWFPQPVIHRVIAKGKLPNGTTAYEIKGDNNPSPDPALVYPNQIISKVVSINGAPLVIPKIGYVTLWIRGL
jgi:signal peptidase